MRILHISRTMGQGGAEKVVYQLCKDNKEAIQFVASCGGFYVNELEKIEVKHINIPDIDKKDFRTIIRTLKILSSVIEENNISIIHTHHRMAAFFSRMLQIKNKNLIHIYTAHNVFCGKRTLLRFAVSKARIVACGETVKENLINEYGISEKRINVIYNSIESRMIPHDRNIELEKLKSNGAYLIASIGRITEQKGFDIFVKAIAYSLKEIPNITGVIIGDGIDRKGIEELVESLGIRNSIIFLGFQKDVISLIEQMEFIVLASRWEGFPLTPLETFSVRKTIIVSDIANNLEIVKSGINGLSFKQGDALDLSKKIIKLVKNCALKTTLENRAYQDFNENFSYSKFIRNYQNVYRISEFEEEK